QQPARDLDAERRAREAEERARAAEDRARVESQARADAERRAGDLETDLRRIVEVRETERGLVVTIPGDVLFEFDRYTLLPTAQLKLGQLADVLGRGDLALTIEGHTDGVGSDAYNLDLSTKRAMVVRDYLVARGIAADRCQVAGYGKTRPLAT